MENQAPEESPRERYLSVLLTIFFGGGFLIFLIMVSGLFFLYVTLAVFAIAGVGYLHYVLWGQSLTEAIAAEQAVENQQPSDKNSQQITDKYGSHFKKE